MPSRSPSPCGGVTFKRAYISYIECRHKGRSTLVGADVGIGTVAGTIYRAPTP